MRVWVRVRVGRLGGYQGWRSQWMAAPSAVCIPRVPSPQVQAAPNPAAQSHPRPLCVQGRDMALLATHGLAQLGVPENDKTSLLPWPNGSMRARLRL